MTSIEVETKVAIAGEEEFRRILACAGTPASVREQLNGYLDRPDGELDRLGWMARIRLTADEAVLTLKRAVAGTRVSSDGLFRAVEIEHRLPRARAAVCLEDGGEVPRGLLDLGPEAPPEVRDILASGPVAILTWSLTIRWTFRDQGRPDLIADETWFPDGSRDFEIEVECDDVAEAQARIRDIANMAGVEVAPQTLTKHARALRHRGSAARRRGR